MSLDIKIKNLIVDRLARIRSHKAKYHMIADLLHPARQQKQDIEQINEQLSRLKIIHNELVPKIKELKKLVPDITDQSALCAVYLIYGKVLQTWESIFLLASRGHNFDTMEFIRSIAENLDLIHTFHLDKSNKYLKQWFEGEIIPHGVSRKIGAEFIEKGKIKAIEEGKLSPQKMATDVYRGFSKYTHCSYGALLDCIDVFNEDFDWNRYAGAHWTLNNIHALENTMVTTLVTLKMTYMAIADPVRFDEVNKILTDFAGPMDDASLAELMAEKDQQD